MKFIIIGLGNFGSSLAEKLTNMHHEVIGVDNQMEKVEAIKDKISLAVCLNSKDPESLNTLPLKNSDAVLVCIGEDEGASLITTAHLKRLKVHRLISRSVSTIHETILEAMGITEIVRPEEESAMRWAQRLTSSSFLDSFELTNDYSVVEMIIPEKFIGKTIGQIGFNKNYHVIVLTTMKQVKEQNSIGASKMVKKLYGTANAETLLKEDDVLVIYGHKKNIQRLLEE
ncbi:potassium channel family protein [Mariniphaga sp.]|uniref:potassium channel family protein n=1 Tax=Mariniphaga sp. TaxID=1954475 RepID=UPI0035680914